MLCSVIAGIVNYNAFIDDNDAWIFKSSFFYEEVSHLLYEEVLLLGLEKYHSHFKEEGIKMLKTILQILRYIFERKLGKHILQ